MIVYENPSVIRIEGHDDNWEEVKKLLTFHSKSAEYATKRFKNAYWYVNKHGEEAYTEKLQEYKDAETVSLLFDGNKTYSGLAQYLASNLNTTIENKLKLPKPKEIPWDKEPKIELRPYQLQAIEIFKNNNHCAVSLPTGSGKSMCLLYIAKYFGLKTVVMAPSISIANQLYSLFKEHLGGKYVGMYGGGKKKTDKLITIGIAASLTRITPGSIEWDHLSKADVFIADESHLCPAETLKSVCTGLMGFTSYRFFASATQMRNDGADLVLEGITGPVLLELTEKEMIDKGYLAKPTFVLAKSYSTSTYASKDPMRMLSKHLYNNAELHKQVAEMANRNVEQLGQKVLIMIDQICQFKYLYPYLKHHTEFAHGGLTDDNDSGIPLKYHDKEPTELVAAFNRGEIPIMVGTSCISIGTDIKPVDVIYNLQGGKSEIKFKQLIGRGTRTTETKKQFFFVDFDIENIPLLHFHYIARRNIYRDFYDNLIYL